MQIRYQLDLDGVAQEGFWFYMLLRTFHALSSFDCNF